MLSTVVACVGAAQAQVLWDESINGNLSNDRLNPTNLALNVGNNHIIGSMDSNDKQYVHFTLAPGMALTQLFVVSYVSQDNAAFIGVQEGSVFTEPAQGANAANLLGYTLWGTEQIGTDILPAMGTGFGSMGFTPPLTGSDYTFWIQQTGDPTDFDLNFVTTPEPGTMSLAIGAGLLILRRRKKK